MTGIYVPVTLRRRVRERAAERCEYCRLAQVGQEATFHLDHVVPQNKGGETTWGNLALACVTCSLRKGARITALDPVTQEMVTLFNPRLDAWTNHFELTEGLLIVGQTPRGRATVELFGMNRGITVSIRHEESLRGRYP